ncbi:MAG TPA: metallophosphoesterase [Gemmataceae bacterium]|nr:metallophosphoesterase [Gemmataceae bacterium]
MATPGKQLRVATVGDIHYGRNTHGSLQPLFQHVNERADVFVICGDLTDHGVPDEAHALARELTVHVKVPIITVLGNHDYHSGKQGELMKIFADAGVRVLDGDSVEVRGVSFAGVKGFGGGFGRHTLEPWGEDTIKQFVHEAIDEALKLETALARSHTPSRIAVLHYAPIQATVEGEPPAIFPFLGSSRLEEPLNRYPVTAVVHGHAHHGAPEGRTSKGVPVYNVSLSLLRQHFGDRPPVRFLEVPVGEEGAAAERQPSGDGQTIRA